MGRIVLDLLETTVRRTINPLGTTRTGVAIVIEMLRHELHGEDHPNAAGRAAREG